ncbi:hypothetical protein CDL15_Pgr011026 [Punica granatum]|uniref:Uncharacterized protein n=1 Tax=Punica granatum TaxID=22663 RepID=A0A218XPK9_PUNGR|nr:hypothetical protein CDL15_Pgr011026 [Punica granatum]
MNSTRSGPRQTRTQPDPTRSQPDPNKTVAGQLLHRNQIDCWIEGVRPLGWGGG